MPAKLLNLTHTTRSSLSAPAPPSVIIRTVFTNTSEIHRETVFRSIIDLESAINAYPAEHNAHPTRFVWTQSANAILDKLDRCRVLSV
jgi:hypothetical protein